jgi:hypothetical protein
MTTLSLFDQIDERVTGCVRIGGFRRIDDGNEGARSILGASTHGQLLIEEAQPPCRHYDCSGVTLRAEVVDVCVQLSPANTTFASNML